MTVRWGRWGAAPDTSARCEKASPDQGVRWPSSGAKMCPRLWVHGRVGGEALHHNTRQPLRSNACRRRLLGFHAFDHSFGGAELALGERLCQRCRESRARQHASLWPCWVQSAVGRTLRQVPCPYVDPNLDRGGRGFGRPACSSRSDMRIRSQGSLILCCVCAHAAATATPLPIPPQAPPCGRRRPDGVQAAAEQQQASVWPRSSSSSCSPPSCPPSACPACPAWPGSSTSTSTVQSAFGHTHHLHLHPPPRAARSW